MKNRKQHPVLQRERVSLLPPRLQQLKTLLSHGPKTIDELVHGLVFDTKKPRDPVAIVRTYLSKLGKHVPILVHFQYGASTYEILPKKSQNTH